VTRSFSEVCAQYSSLLKHVDNDPQVRDHMERLEFDLAGYQLVFDELREFQAMREETILQKTEAGVSAE
jgi:hypothetical protein